MADSMAQYWQQLGEQRGLQIGEQRGLQIGEQRGIQIGEERGRSSQAREMLLAVLRTRFGEVPTEVLALVEKQDAPWCVAAVARMATAASLEELRD